jgi:phenylacetate-CoA ligase
LQQAESLFKQAWQTVPFYRQRLQDVTKLRSGVLCLEHIRQIPLLRKSDIQDHKADLMSRALPKSHLPLHKMQTSGSTGPPVTVNGTNITANFQNALGLRWNGWHRRNFNFKLANIRFPLPVRTGPPRKHRPWVRGFTTGPKVSIGSDQPVERQIEWLLDENPHYLSIFPTNLDALLDRCEKSGIRFSNLREVQTRGEALSTNVPARCDEVLGVPLNDLYGVTEFGYVAMQCPDTSNYHVQSEHLLVEVLDDDGNSVAPGSMGRVVITDLHNFAMPLIRYDVGDLAVVGSTCSCGRGLLVLEKILGRTRSLFVLPSGDKYMPLYSDALFELKKISQALNRPS